MAEQERHSAAFGWTYDEVRRRQLEAGLRMTPGERLAWLERTLDELLPLLGRAREAERKAHSHGPSGENHAGDAQT
ncbi:MAG: hypothetical protein LJE95_16200 [Acidobacteria bacterium]|nr:hypothetical protein [Acidobacteriota bacterium]